MSYFPLARDALCLAMERRGWRIAMMPVVVLVLLAILQGCYLPESYKIDLSMTRQGDYQFSYQGLLVHPGLAEDLMAGEIDSAAEQERADVVARDLGRDSGLKALVYRGQGVFDIRYERQGNIIADKTFSFVRRNAKILEMSYRQSENIVEIRGGFVPAQYRERLAAMGYKMQGEIEIRTEAGIRSHNAASFDKTGDENRLRWAIESLDDPVPVLIIG
ncbi:MAG: hypothetical protein ABID63_00670 [Pseudomonadota bacterium]